MSFKKIKVPVLLGATAVGKSLYALRIASELGLEIISCDSRQLYRTMDIGTAKPSLLDREKVNHSMIDIIEPSETFSAFRFAKDAGAIIRKRASEGKGVMICGGTGLYFQALANGMGPQVEADPAIRKRYQDLAATAGKDAVYAKLMEVDAVTAQSSHSSNISRNIRALEVFETTGKPLSEQKKLAVPPDDLEFFPIVLTLSRDTLYTRINKRVDDMIGLGLWNEFLQLIDRGYTATSPGLQCVGYRELFDVAEKKCSLESAIDLIKQNTRHYAKRQMTWFRHQLEAVAVDVENDGVGEVKKLVEAFLTK